MAHIIGLRIDEVRYAFWSTLIMFAPPPSQAEDVAKEMVRRPRRRTIYARVGNQLARMHDQGSLAIVLLMTTMLINMGILFYELITY